MYQKLANALQNNQETIFFTRKAINQNFDLYFRISFSRILFLIVSMAHIKISGSQSTPCVQTKRAKWSKFF